MRLSSLYRLNASLLPGILVIVFSSGCASFRSDRVATPAGWPPSATDAPADRPVALLLVTAMNQDNLQCKVPTENERQADYIRASASKAARESGLFRQVLSDASGKSNISYTIDTTIHARTEAGVGTMFMAGLCGATLGIIPCTISEEFEFVGVIRDRENTEIFRHGEREHVRSWLHLFMIPAYKVRPDDVYNQMWLDMYRSFFDRARKSGALSAPATP